MISPASLAHIDRFWASFFGCTLDDLQSPGTAVLPHAALEGFPGIILFRRGDGCLISVPAPVRDHLAARLALPPNDIFDAAALASRLGGAVRLIIGPAFVGYVDAGNVVRADTLGARSLSAADDAPLRVLAGSVSRTEWEHSGIEFGGEGLMGLFVERRLVAAGRLESRGSHIADLGLVTASGERGKGYGRAVAAALTERGTSQGQIIQYRTLLANAPSMAIAHSLGYTRYAETISVQLNRV